ncbi:MAG: choice-of-anchor D domain-containing protein, partial [Chloroflexota bacterium]
MQGNSQSIASGDTTPDVADDTDFGAAPIGAPIVKTFTIENMGLADLHLVGTPDLVTISGVDAADFVITAVPTTPILPSTTTTFQLTFTPSVDGPRTATLTINNNDADENPYTFDILGVGIGEPEIDVQGLGLSIVNGDTTPDVADDTDFGSTGLGGSIVKTFTIFNVGTADLALTGSPLVAVSGANAAEFVVTTPPANPVLVAGSTTVQITFTPAANGIRTATLTIASNDADENPYTFNIQGAAAIDTSLIVDTNSDDGALQVCDDATPNDCSLRGAITKANAAATLHTIAFDIGGGGAQTIDLDALLPIATAPVTIDATTQPGFGGSNLITLDASGINGSILTLSGNGSSVQHLTIANASGIALYLNGADNTIVNGSDLSSSGSRVGTGIYVANSSSPTLSNNNASNRNTGISLANGSDATVTGNDLTGSGSCSYGASALQMSGVGGSIAISGITYTSAPCAVRFTNMSDLTISNVAGGGTNNVLEDASG